MSSAGGRATRGGCRASVVGVDAGSPAGGLLTSGSGYSGSGDVGGDRRRSSSSSSSSVASWRSEEHTSELQSLMRISYAVFCLKKKNKHTDIYTSTHSANNIYS